MRLRHLAPLVLLALAGHLACGPTLPEEAAPAAIAARLETPNGLFQNSLSSNGLFQNGLFQNGLFQNGLFQNGLFQNGLFQNGLFQNGLFQNGLWQANLPARELLRSNAQTREFLKYLYECAMPVGVSTVLDPGGANLELKGLIGLAPDWNQPSGTCDESCQRWLTACLLARTNAYGVKVDLSMRAPDDAPPHVKAALAVTEQEKAAYPLREGAFYGNLFRQVPRPGDGATVMAPSLHGCAGPGSNIPQVTKRFCSSQGAGGPIQVAGTCEPRSEFPYSACLGVSGEAATGAMHDCYERTDPNQRGEHYREAITVYLKRPIEVCGNSICEENEAAEASCASDCHPGGWTQSFAQVLTGIGGPSEIAPDEGASVSAWVRTSALDHDGTLVLAGVAPSTIDLGGGPRDPGPDGKQYGALAKYETNGAHRWSKRFGFGFTGQVAPVAVAVAADGSIGVALNEYPPSGHGIGGERTWVAKFSSEGDLLWAQPFVSALPHDYNRGDAIAFDAAGNLFVAGQYYGYMSVGGVEVTHGDDYEFVLKLSPDGALQWGTAFGYGASFGGKTIIATPNGNALFSLDYNGSHSVLWHLDGATGETTWTKWGYHGGIAVGPNGNVYAAGAISQDSFSFYSFDVPPTAQTGDFFVVEYAAADGAPLRARVISPECDENVPFCRNNSSHNWIDGRDVTFDADGNLIVGVLGGSEGATIDFGAGPFRTYATDDVFVAAFSPELEPLWAKHVPMVLDGSVGGMQFDALGRIILSGTFAGSMLIDDRLLVSHIPEQEGVGNTFLAAFTVPSTSDLTPPTVTDEHLPQPMTLEATSDAGAQVFYLPPTSLDSGLAGVSVSCSPPPNAFFPVGQTTVTCTATDPLGNHSSASFPITVVDHLGPALTNLPAPIIVPPDGPTGAVVTFAPPLALDLVDGSREVTCDHASGSTFPFGTTTVTCSATDASGNTTTSSFPVSVTYAWSGLLKPLDSDGQAFPVGTKLKVRFRLLDASAGITNANATLTVAKVVATPAGAEARSPSPAAVSEAMPFRYNPSKGWYEYDLATKSMAPGEWNLHVQLGDGVPHSVQIRLWR